MCINAVLHLLCLKLRTAVHAELPPLHAHRPATASQPANLLQAFRDVESSVAKQLRNRLQVLRAVHAAPYKSVVSVAYQQVSLSEQQRSN